MKLVFTALARQDLTRLRDFIAENNPGAAQRAAARIKAAAILISQQPLMGRAVRAPAGSSLDVRELPIAFGASGYLIRLLGATEGTIEIPGIDGLVLGLDTVWAEIERFEGRETGVE